MSYRVFDTGWYQTMKVNKKIVTDDQRRPVAVQIDYADWLKIARALDLESAEVEGTKDKPPPGTERLRDLLEASKGIWQGGDGLEYQRRIRAEWTRPWDLAQDEDDKGVI